MESIHFNTANTKVSQCPRIKQLSSIIKTNTNPYLKLGMYPHIHNETLGGMSVCLHIVNAANLYSYIISMKFCELSRNISTKCPVIKVSQYHRHIGFSVSIPIKNTKRHRFIYESIPTYQTLCDKQDLHIKKNHIPDNHVMTLRVYHITNGYSSYWLRKNTQWANK